MSDHTSFSGKRVALLGLGVCGLSMLDFLLPRGARVTVRDRRDAEALPLSRAELEARGVRLVCGQRYLDDIDEEILFRSPGMRPDLAPLQAAVLRGARLTDEVSLFCALSPATLLGVTGSDGKTTTASLAAHLLRGAMRDCNTRVSLGGNIGTPLITLLPKMRAGDLCVAELSSFQLMSCPPAPARAIITNITENHLNWHRDMAEYTDAKKNILGDATHAVLNAENAVTAAIAAERADKTLFSFRRTHRELAPLSPTHTVTAEGGMLAYDGEGLFPLSTLPLPGRHNLENLMAAVGLVMPYVRAFALAAATATFRGVPHRLQEVAVRDGVRYYNSSIDSTPTRTAAALSALGGTPILLCGGRGKGLSFAPLVQAVRGRVRALLLFGEAREEIGRAMEAAGVPYLSFPTMRKAVLYAMQSARTGDTVLLSPACTSFDEFCNFEDRGNEFCRLVGNIQTEGEPT